MHVTREDRVRMERAHVLAWPALHTAMIDGWVWRHSGGGSQRANSVSAVDFTGADLGAAIDAVEARYRDVGAVARFQTYDETAPAGLAEALRARGYAPGETTVTMFRRQEPVVAVDDVVVAENSWDEWFEVYLRAITESRRVVNREILSLVPRPRAFFGCRRDGRIVSTALCVIGLRCAVIECVATAAEARQHGAARFVLQHLLAWAASQRADLVGLQVVEGNVPAMRLYESLGFVTGATNRFWVERRPALMD